MKNKKILLPVLLCIAFVFGLMLPSTVEGSRLVSSTLTTPASLSNQPMSLRLQEDFEDGQDQGWSHSGGGIVSIEDDASIGDDPNNKVYNLQGLHDGTQGFAANPFYDGSADWDDYEVEFDVKIHEWDSHFAFYFRFSDWLNYYTLAIRTGYGSWGYGGRFELNQWVNGQEIDDMNGYYNRWIGAPVEVGTWYHIKVSAIGDRIQLYFNGELKFDRTGARLSKGKIGFVTQPWPGNPADWPYWSGGKLASYGHVHIDNIRVFSPTILSVPYYNQNPTLWCLPCSMSMIFEYYGRHIHSWDIAKKWGWGRNDCWQFWEWLENQDFSATRDYFEEYGLDTMTTYVTSDKSELFDFIKNWINAGSPLLLVLSYPIRHAVVIVGYDDAKGTVYVNDPSGALVDDFLPPEKRVRPYIAIEIQWDLMSIPNASWAMAVSGTSYLAHGSLDMQDISVEFQHLNCGASSTRAVWDYRYGEDKGLIWQNAQDHPLSLDANDYLFFYDYLVNHTSNEQSYSLEVSFGLDTSRYFDILNVGSRSDYSHIIFAVPLRDWLTRQGEYAMTLTLWDQSRTRKYDEITFPPISYDPLLEFTLCSAANICITDPGGYKVGTGLSTGEIVNQIEGAIDTGPSSHPRVIMIPKPLQAGYNVSLVGVSGGIYTLTGELAGVSGDNVAFLATDIPISLGSIHQDYIDWNALSKGEPGITIEKDHDGDGEIDETIITGIPKTPTNPSPVNDATEVSIHKTLSWVGDDSNTVTYNVYFGTEIIAPLVSERQAETTYAPTLNPGITYYWRVAATNEHSICNPGTLWSFTTEEAMLPGLCFIATAAYGTPMAGEVQILREFRDKYLLTNPMGRAFVDFYYRISPPIAEFITEHPSLKPIVRAGLVPVVAISAVAVNITPIEKIAILGLLVLVSVAVAVWVMRRRGRGPEYT